MDGVARDALLDDDAALLLPLLDWRMGVERFLDKRVSPKELAADERSALSFSQALPILLAMMCVASSAISSAQSGS